MEMITIRVRAKPLLSSAVYYKVTTPIVNIELGCHKLFYFLFAITLVTAVIAVTSFY